MIKLSSAVLLALALTSCANLVGPLDPPAGDHKGEAVKPASHQPFASAAESVAFHATERFNAQMTDGPMIYADKMEFTDSVHSHCLATGHVWLKFPAQPGEYLSRDVFCAAADIEMFARTLRLTGSPMEITAMEKSRRTNICQPDTIMELDLSGSGQTLRMLGPNRIIVEPVE